MLPGKRAGPLWQGGKEGVAEKKLPMTREG